MRAWLCRGSRLARLPLAAVLVLVATPIAASAQTTTPSGPTPPPNDNVGSPSVVRDLPTTLTGTTVGATTEANEPQSTCASQPTKDSVWYSFRSPTAQRLAVDIAAAGKLDAVIDVYHQVRSQTAPVACQQTDAQGKAAVAFSAALNGVYVIRVAALQNSVDGRFTIDVFHPREAANPPGTALPSGGASGVVDRIQNVNQAYSVILRAGVSYKINLANETTGGCVSAGLYPPGTSSFDSGSSVLQMRCTSYRLFTPDAGQGGRYSFDVTPTDAFTGNQRFHLQVAPAGPEEMAPGVFVGNYAHMHGRLDGRADTVVRLYRFDVTTHSNLTLRLIAPSSADFDLELRGVSGDLLGCACGNSGSQTLNQQLNQGRYFAVVRARNATVGSFTLIRESRTITATSISFGGTTKGGGASPGQSTPIQVRVTPGAAGPVRVTIGRFDPIAGWQFFRVVDTTVSGGSATIPFVAPSLGRWRAKASFAGSSTFSASDSGLAYVFVAGPLRQ